MEDRTEKKEQQTIEPKAEPRGIKALVVQFIKFGLVGVSNTAISYGVDQLFYYVVFRNSAMEEKLKITIVSALAFFVSVTNSYFWNNRFVFKSENRKSVGQHLYAYFKTVLCYALTGLVLAPAIKVWLSGVSMPESLVSRLPSFLFAEGNKLPYWVLSIVPLIVSIPLNFVLNKFWAFRSRDKKQEQRDE